MDRVIDVLKDIETLVLILTNIIMAIYSVYSTIKARRWQQTASFIGQKLRKQEEKTITAPKTREKLVFAAPPNIKEYISKINLE